MRRRNPNPGLTELWYRLKQKGYSRTVESLYRCMRREGLIKPSMAQKKAPAKPYQKIARKGIKIECVRTDNGFEFTNRFSNSKRDIFTLFEAAELHIRHKRIKPYTPRITEKSNAVTEKINACSTTPISSIRSTALVGNWPFRDARKLIHEAGHIDGREQASDSPRPLVTCPIPRESRSCHRPPCPQL